MPRRRQADRDRHAALLGAYVAPAVVAHILSDGRVPLPSGVRVQVVILFADLSGFTRLAARLPADQVVAMLDNHFEAMTVAAAGSGATIDKLIGDAIMLVFGIPVALGDEALRALHVAAAMHAEFAALADRWRASGRGASPVGLAIGCAVGEVVLANVGSAARMDYTVIGAAVNRAARLVAIAARGTTLVDEGVRRQAEAQGGRAFAFGPRRALHLKGFAGTVAAYAARARLAVAVSPRKPARVDPVCGMKLPAPTAYHLRHAGRRIYFCSRRCRERFAAARTARARTAPAGRRRQHDSGAKPRGT